MSDEDTLETRIAKINTLEFDVEMKHYEYMVNCRVLESMLFEIAQSEEEIKYDILRNVICSYEGQELPKYAALDASLGTEKGVDFIGELYSIPIGTEFETITVGNAELDTPNQMMTKFTKDLIEEYLLVDSEGSEVDEDEDLEEYVNDQKALPEPFAESVCDMKIILNRLAPREYVDAINTEDDVDSLYEIASCDFLLYEGFKNMPEDTMAVNKAIMRYGIFEDSENFYRVFNNIEKEYGKDEESSSAVEVMAELLPYKV